MLIINKYNRLSAINYAQKYALQSNPEYHNYQNEGGNCTNFISQCLYAGAPKMNISPKGWYYFSPYNTSESWANVVPMYWFLTHNKGESVFASESNLEMCELGDIIQIKFFNKPVYSHAVIVTKIYNHTPNGIYICANSNNVLNQPLSRYKYEKIRLLHILGYRTTSL